MAFLKGRMEPLRRINFLKPPKEEEILVKNNLKPKCKSGIF